MLDSMVNSILSYFPEILLAASGMAGLIILWCAKPRKFLESNSGAIAVIFALITGVYVLKEHEISEQNSRLDRTRSYIERIESGAVHESRQWLDLHWIRNRDLITQIDEANFGKNADRETAKKLLDKYSRNFNEKDDSNIENIRHVMRLFYFYADLAKCVDLGLCDTKTACNLFASDIGKFYILHAGFISDWREVSFEQNFDVIKEFVNESCKDI